MKKNHEEDKKELPVFPFTLSYSLPNGDYHTLKTAVAGFGVTVGEGSWGVTTTIRHDDEGGDFLVVSKGGNMGYTELLRLPL